MLRKITSAVTLLELLVAIVLIFLVVLAFSSIELFSRGQLLNTERRARLQNEVSLAMDHISKQMMRTRGNELMNDENTAVDLSANIGGNAAVHFYVESPANWAAYRYTGNTGNPSARYQIQYCPQCGNKPCAQCSQAWADEVVARHIARFNPVKPADSTGRLTSNFITVTLTACWDPATATLPNGTPDNPCVTMTNRISLPSVSTN